MRLFCVFPWRPEIGDMADQMKDRAKARHRHRRLRQQRRLANAKILQVYERLRYGPRAA